MVGVVSDLLAGIPNPLSGKKLVGYYTLFTDYESECTPKVSIYAENYGYGFVYLKFSYEIDNTSGIYDGLESELSLEKVLSDWALICNSPWDFTCEEYAVRVKPVPGTFESDAECPWSCRYKVVGYEGITGKVYGYGLDAKTALSNCIGLFNFIQKKYNPEDDNF